MKLQLLLLVIVVSMVPCVAHIRGLRKHDESVHTDEDPRFRILRKLQKKGEKGEPMNKGEIAASSPAASPTTTTLVASPAASPTAYSVTGPPSTKSSQGVEGMLGKGGKGGRGKGDMKRSSKSKGKGGTIVAPPPAITVELEFVQLPPNATIPIGTGEAPTQIGTVFIFNDVLLDYNLTLLNGTFVTGVCTRTVSVTGIGNNSSLVGAGYCHFTYTITNDASTVTFNAVGEVVDIFGGTLAITGGTGELAGASGEVQIVPTYAQDPPTSIDFFVDAVAYVGLATLFV